MKKKYIKPNVEPTFVDMLEIMAASKVQTGGEVQDEYNEKDVTYSRQNAWSDDEEE